MPSLDHFILDKREVGAYFGLFPIFWGCLTVRKFPSNMGNIERLLQSSTHNPVGIFKVTAVIRDDFKSL